MSRTTAAAFPLKLSYVTPWKLKRTLRSHFLSGGATAAPFSYNSARHRDDDILKDAELVERISFFSLPVEFFDNPARQLHGQDSKSAILCIHLEKLSSESFSASWIRTAPVTVHSGDMGGGYEQQGRLFYHNWATFLHIKTSKEWCLSRWKRCFLSTPDYFWQKLIVSVLNGRDKNIIQTPSKCVWVFFFQRDLPSF